jgi:hypothetical protein
MGATQMFTTSQWPERQLVRVHSILRPTERLAAMGLFKPETYRFFVIGFALGAVFVISTMDTNVGSALADNVVPVAEAQAAQ